MVGVRIRHIGECNYTAINRGIGFAPLFPSKQRFLLGLANNSQVPLFGMSKCIALEDNFGRERNTAGSRSIRLGHVNNNHDGKEA